MKPDADNPWNDENAFAAIEQQAADWLVRQDRGLTPSERQEFELWLRADERHAETYAEVEETWSKLGQLRESAPAPVVVSSGNPRRLRRRRKALWFGTTLAAAAALTFACLTLWQTPATPTPATYSTTASTEIGDMRRVSLPDGSVIQLNTATAVEINYTATERRVQLVRGEAHFQVAKNPARPFIVSVGQIAVRAVGTAFNVRMRPESVEVLVTEGKVRVDDAVKGQSLLNTPLSDELPVLVAGQRAFVRVEPSGAAAARATAVGVPSAEINQTLSWQTRRLEFVATPLAEIVAEFNRYNRHQLVIADPRLATRRFGGTFPAGDYEELVRLLEAEFNVVAERGANETRLRLAP